MALLLRDAHHGGSRRVGEPVRGVGFVVSLRVAREAGGASRERALLAVGNPPFSGSSVGATLTEIQVVGERVIYREDTGALAWVNLDASDCRIIAKVPVSNNLDKHSWVMDDQYIYVIADDQALYAVPYP